MVCLLRRLRKMEKTNNETFNRKLFADHLIITFIIAIICWGLCIILGLNGITKDKHAWINIPYVLGAFSTTIASYITLKKNNEVTGFKDWLRHVFDFKQNILSYLLVIALAVIHSLLMSLIGGYEMAAPIYMIFLALPIMLIGGGLEEAGWRYITFPEMDKKLGFLISAFMTGIIWAIWHLPLFFIPGVHQYGKNFLGFTITVIGLSFALATIRKVTGSIWLCVLFHMIVNAVPESIRYDIYGSFLASTITTIVLIIVSLILVHICENFRING